MAEAVVKRSISLPVDLAAAIDEARGMVPFSTFVADRLRRGMSATPAGVQAVRSQVATRQPTSAEARANVRARPKGSK